MAAAAILSITLVPVLMGWLIRGRIPAEQANPINRWLTHAYRPALDWVLDRPKKALVIAALVFATSLWPMTQIGRSEEHTSELQSLMRLSSAVFCLKNTNKHIST